MEKIRITQPTLGLDFEFEPDAGVEVDNQYVFDIIKKENLVTGSAMLEAWQKPNTTEEDKEFIRQAYKSKYFDDESDGDFVDAIKEGFFSFGRGVGNVAEINNANEKYEQLLVDTGQAKKEEAPVVPMGYGGFTLGGKGTEFKELPEATQKILEEDPQSARFSFGVLSKKDRQKIDKTALDFFNYFRKINTDGNVVTQAMDFVQGNTDAFKSRENDPGKMRDRVKYFLKRNKLNYEDDGLVDEVIRRGGEIGRAQENVDFYQGLAEWSGGYSMLSNFITKYGAKAGHRASKMAGGITGMNAKPLGDFDDNEEIDIDLNYLAENNRLAKGMEEGAENVAIAFGDKKAELALRDELIKPNPDSAMVYSFAPDIPVELVTAGIGGMTQAGVSSFRRFATKGQIEMLEQETQRVLRNIGKSEEAIAFNKQNDGLGVLSGEADATRFASATSRQNKKLDILEKTLSAQKAELNKLVTRTNELTGNLTKPGFLQEGVGNLSRGIGYGADGLGRTIEVVRSLTKEAGVDLIMKVTKKTPEEAERMFFTIAGVGGVGIGVGAFGNENIDADFYDVLKGIGILLGPEILQKTGTSLRHLGTHWVASNGSKNVFEHVQQLNSKNPKFSNIIIDRTNGVDFMGKTLPAIGNIFRRGDTGEFMGKQGITRPERFVARSLVDTGADKALSFMGRAGLSATTASTLPTAFGYAMGGEEGAGMALGASLPIIGLGVGTGEIVRHNSKTMAQLKQRGDIANHRKNLSTDQAFLFDRLSQSNQAGLASAQIAFPDAQIQLVQGKDMRSAGSQTIRNGRSIIKVNIDSEMPLLPVLSHEIGHHIKAHGLTPLIHDIMFGDPLKNKGGLFSRFDIETGKFLIENIDGVNRYETNDQFNGLREKYIKALENQPGGIDELTRREYSTREAIADEVFAEYVAQHILSNKSRDLSTGMLRSLFGAMSGKPFLRKAGHNMGLFSRSDDNLMFQVLPESPELNNLITEFQKKSGRLSPEELADQDGIISRSDESENDVIITPEEQLKDPQILEAFNTGGIFKTDADGKIIYGIGGKPKLMTKTQIENQQGQMANDLLQAIENAGDSLPAGHVVMNDNETASGMFLSDAIIDKLQGYNASQKEFLRQVSAVGRRMAGPDGQTNPGNQAIMFYFSAMKHGGKYYRSLRGGYRNMLIYGMEVSKDKNIYFRTISFDQLDDNINYLLKHKAFGKQLIETFGGNSIGEVRKMINDKFDVYYSNQAKGIENGTDGSGITEGEKNFLNAFLGNTGSGNVDRNPILSALGKKQAEKMTAIRSRRLDRIGSIEFPGGGQPVRIRKIIDNLMPGRKNPDQLEMEFERGPTIVQEEPKPNFSWYKMNGVDPEDPNRLPKIADRLISPGNRDADGDIARDMHQNFGVTFREMIDALDKAHSRDEYKNSRYRYMPNLGLKDNVVDQVLPAINQEKFSGEQFNSAIGKVAGAKAYADDIGLTSFLEGKKSVTKTDIEDYVAENHLNLDSYDLADSKAIRSIDEILNIYKDFKYPNRDAWLSLNEEQKKKHNEELTAHSKKFRRENPNLRVVADDLSYGPEIYSVQELIEFKEQGYTEVTTESNNRTKYNRNSLVTPGERSNYNETLVEFEGGGRFEVPESSTLQYEGVIEFADPDLIDNFLHDMSIQGHEDLNYRREYKEDLMDAVEVVAFKGNAEEYKIIKEIAENYKFEGVSITPGESIVDLPGGPPTFTNNHWDSDKVIGHIRRTDRTIDGKDTRFLEEMQSDWLQAMRKGNAPDAPFAKNWPALLLKKAMMDAINDGKTHIAWADGKVHNDRYSLTRTLDDITMQPGVTPGIRELYLNTKEQGDIQLQTSAEGKVLNSDHEGFVGKGLDEVIGKQMADKILEEPSWDMALRRKKLNALDQEIDKYKEFAEEFITGKFKPFRYDNRKYGDFIRNGKLSDLSPVLQNEYKKWKDPDGLNIDANLIVGRGNLTDFIGDKIRELQKQYDQALDGTIKYEGKDLDLSDPALPNFYDKEVVKVATKLAKKLGVGKPEKVGVSEGNGAWMMELPTKQALGEQTLYMPTLGDEAPKGPSSPPEVVQSNSMARRIKYKGIPAQEISNRIAQVSTELLEYGSDSNPQVESTRGSLYQAKRNGIIRELNELNEVEAGMLNQGDRFMPATGQTKTKEFKNWFKDSKVVDEDGNPLVVYRGQTEWSKDGTTDYKYERSAPSFTSVPEVANLYSHQQKGSFFNTKLKPKGAVAPVYLKMVNPLRIETLENISKTQGSVFEILDASNFNWDFYGDVKTDKSLWTINDTIDLFENLSESAEPIFIEIDRGFGMPNIADDAFEVVEYLSNKLEKHQDKLRKFDKDSSGYMRLEDDFTEDINYFLDNVKIDTYAFADTHIARDYAERNGFDGFIHEDVAEGMIPYSKLESVAGKPIEDVKGINTLDEDGYKLEQKDYFFTAYKPFNPTQIKSAIGNRGTFDPGNPDIRFMPSLHPEAMPVVQATDSKTGKLKVKPKKNAQGKIIKGKFDPVYETIDYDLINSPLVKKHNKKTNNKKVPWDKLSVASLRNASTAKEKGHKQLIQDIYNTDLVDIASQKLADEYTNVWSKDPSVQAGTGWYSRMRKSLSKALGKQHEMFAQLLGATSARTPVEENFSQAFEALTLFKQGKYTTQINKFLEGYNALQADNIVELAIKKGVVKKSDFTLADGKTITGAISAPKKAFSAWCKYYDLIPRKSDGSKYNANSGQVMRVLAGKWLELTSSPKTPNFAGNLTGRTLEATIDVWAGRYLRRMLYDGEKTWRIQPMSETGVSDVDFALGQLIFREAGKKIGMNPDDLQAIAWFGEKGVWEQSGWTSETGALKSSFDESFDVFFPKGRKPRNFQEGREIMKYKASQRLLAKAEDMQKNPNNYPDKTTAQIEEYLKAKTNEESKRKALPNVARFLNE